MIQTALRWNLTRHLFIISNRNENYNIPTRLWNQKMQHAQDRPDLLTDPSNDRFIVPQPYLTAAQVERLRHEKAREIECFLRMCFAWRRVRRLREAKLKMEEAEQLGTCFHGSRAWVVVFLPAFFSASVASQRDE